MLCFTMLNVGYGWLENGRFLLCKIFASKCKCCHSEMFDVTTAVWCNMYIASYPWKYLVPGINTRYMHVCLILCAAMYKYVPLCIMFDTCTDIWYREHITSNIDDQCYFLAVCQMTLVYSCYWLTGYYTAYWMIKNILVSKMIPIHQ